METLKRKARIAGLILAPFLLIACLNIAVVEDVKNPDRYFKRAYSQIEEIHRQYPNREKRAHRLHLLVYDSSDQDLIRITAPLWLVNGCLDLGMKAAENGDDFDFEERYDFDWRAIKDLGKFGQGLLVEIEDEKDKILIWLQ